MHVHEKIPLTLPWDILPIDDQLIRLGFQGLIRPSLEISALFGLLSLVHDTLLWESPQHVLGRCSSQWAILAAIHSQSSWALSLHTCLHSLWTLLRFDCISWSCSPPHTLTGTLLQLPHSSSDVKNFPSRAQLLP